MRELTTRAGVELIQDFIGAAYWQRNLHCLKVGGRLVLVGLMGGTKVEADLGLILRQRLHIIGLVMEPISGKQNSHDAALPGTLVTAAGARAYTPYYRYLFPLAEAAAAHQYMEDNRNVGKIMLIVE